MRHIVFGGMVALFLSTNSVRAMDNEEGSRVVTKFNENLACVRFYRQTFFAKVDNPDSGSQDWVIAAIDTAALKNECFVRLTQYPPAMSLLTLEVASGSNAQIYTNEDARWAAKDAFGHRLALRLFLQEVGFTFLEGKDLSEHLKESKPKPNKEAEDADQKEKDKNDKNLDEN